ncbi:hypothetical protein QEN19_001395 [Hanseniaspora menglaensis]
MSERIPLLNSLRKKTLKKGISNSLIKKLLIFVSLAAIIITIVLQFLIIPPKSFPSERKKNFIFFVTDGTGPNYITMARNYKQFISNDYSQKLHLDEHLAGTSRTRSNSSWVTDSAAGATAFSCMLKTYNGAIGVNPFQNPCGTVLEAAKLAKYLTGLVVTTRITDATPAAFSAHVDYRSQEDQIAEQQIGNGMVDLMIGGGLQHFVSTGRKDGRNIIQELANDWTIANNASSFFDIYNSNISAKHNILPFISLFEMGDVPFQIDRENMEYDGPSLKEEAELALNLLHSSSENKKGFFLLIEGSRIDHCGHSNDAACIPREVMAFDEAFEYVKSFADKHPEEDFIMFSTSDHETGGMTLSRQLDSNYPDYVWFPEVIHKVKHSGQYMTKKLLTEENIDKDYIETKVMAEWMGIEDYTKQNVKEILTLIQQKDAGSLQDYINNLVSTRARIGFTTHGHSAVDVNTYVHANSESLLNYVLQNVRGNRENIEFGNLVVEFLGLNMTAANEFASEVNHGPLVFSTQQSSILSFDEYHKDI